MINCQGFKCFAAVIDLGCVCNPKASNNDFVGKICCFGDGLECFLLSCCLCASHGLVAELFFSVQYVLQQYSIALYSKAYVWVGLCKNCITWLRPNVDAFQIQAGPHQPTGEPHSTKPPCVKVHSVSHWHARILTSVAFRERLVIFLQKFGRRQTKLLARHQHEMYGRWVSYCTSSCGFVCIQKKL